MHYSVEALPDRSRTPRAAVTPRSANRERQGPRHLLAQFALITAAALAYFAVRGFTQGSESVAIANANHVLGLEQLFGIDVRRRCRISFSAIAAS